MSLFSKPKLVLWPKSKTVDLYLDRKENNTFSFDLNLWQDLSPKDLEPLALYLNQNRFSSASILIPDDIIITKSFTYDSKIDSIDKKEVISLASNFVTFQIDPNSLEYKLSQENNKTIIQAFIYDKPKMDILKANLGKVGLSSFFIKSVSAAISTVISSIYKQEFFLVYPLNDQEYTLLLSKDNSVYLTVNVKGPSLDIQKIVNYSNFYFSSVTKKIYLPSDKEIEINTTTEMDKTIFNEPQIAQSFSRSSNLPLPVLGELYGLNSNNAAIINAPADNINLPIKKMEKNKKNILPLVAVFIFTAALASVIIWVVLNRNASTTDVENIEETSEITETVAPIETPIPTPTIAEISKDIKIQVLNATDINGQAATLKATLVALGFTNVTVGNATGTATENSVSVKAASTSAYFDSKLVTDFPATYTTDLKATSAFDAVFTIGTDLSTGASVTSKVTPTVTKTATPSVTKAVTKAPTATPTE